MRKYFKGDGILVQVKKLIIAEKRNAAQRIAGILSNGKANGIRRGREIYYEWEDENDFYYVIPLRGHIVELDYEEKFKRWDIDNLIELVNSNPRKINKERGIIKLLWEIAKDVDEIIIATDYDREGELIGIEALSLIEKKYGKKFRVKRAKFSALTHNDIIKAFKNLVDINYNLASAAEARQEIDLAWGASLTRFMSIVSGKRGKDFLSVGRVQSPTLALIVEREEKIKDFKPKKYWEITGKFMKRRIFKGNHIDNPFWNREDVEKIMEKIRGEKDGFVKDLKVEDKKILPPVPFNTTEFLSEATKLGFSAARAMRIAEDLYMAGYISYPRTDNTVYPKSLNINAILNSLEKTKFGEEIKKLRGERRKYPMRGKKESKDHPPIVPTRGGEIKGEKGVIYELIVRRFLATLARDLKYREKVVIVDVRGEKFKSIGREVEDEGWLKYYPYYKFKFSNIPDLKIGEKIRVRDIRMDEKETKPPPRYTQSSLIKEMEKLNLGTKSTRAEIIQKLYDRGYVVGRTISPTKLGIAIIESLKNNEVDVVKPDMTAKLEIDMDKISEGNMNKEKVIEESKEMLIKILEKLNSQRRDVREKIKESMKYEIGVCDGGKLVYYERKRLVICEGENKKFFNLPKTGKIEFLDRKCPICGLPLIKIIRKGQSPEIRCLDSKCEYNKKKDVVGKCPKCGGDLIIRQSKNGKRFLGCSNYPKCNVTYSLPQKGEIIPTGEVCPYCGAPLLILRRKGRRDWKFCPNIKCEYNRRNKK